MQLPDKFIGQRARQCPYDTIRHDTRCSFNVCSKAFSLLQQLCTVDNGIFYTADVNVFLLLN